ncbi:MAG: ABC transporter permease [Anaerolineaceae bacterium]|nr:ABC transporter permease [Anaerolineaceae bacterium]
MFLRQLLPPIRRLFNGLLDTTPLLIALLAALLVSAGLLLALNADPIRAYGSMFQGAFGTENAVAETVVKAIPLLFVGIGVCIAFRGGVTNIGGEGQMIAGAVVGTATALALADSPNVVVIGASLGAGFLAGALYGGLAGFLKAYFGVNEILSTIMLNQIAFLLMNYILNGPLLDPTEIGTNHIPKTAKVAQAAQLPRLSIVLPDSIYSALQGLGYGGNAELFAKTRMHFGLVLAVILAFIVYMLLWRTTIGYRIRAVGQNERAARYAGINVKRQMMLAMFLAGGCAGLAGVVQVLGLQYRLQTDGSATGFTANAGFNGIVAALFGGLNPIGVIPASIFFGGLLVGAQKMQRDVGIPAALITAINGLIVIFVVSSQVFVKRRIRMRSQAVQPPHGQSTSALNTAPVEQQT